MMMALWQFDALLVPRKRLQELLGELPDRVSHQALDQGDWWEQYSLSEQDERLIASFAPPRPTWSSSLKSWGEEDGHRIDIYRENGNVEEVSVRIDARDVSSDFVQHVAALANRWDCVIVAADLHVIPALAGELRAAVEDSAAGKFVRDPEGYFRSDGAQPDA